MSTTRKRVGGGWKNVQVIKTDDHDSGISFKEATNENMRSENISDSSTKRQSDIAFVKDTKLDNPGEKDSAVEINDDLERKLRHDELDNEKSREKTSRNISGKSERTKIEIKSDSDVEKQNSHSVEEHFEDSAIESVTDSGSSMLLPDIRSSVSTLASGKSKHRTKGSKAKVIVIVAKI
jgi:hypothetical protein